MADEARRSPCGERGLKSPEEAPNVELPPSLPMRGAWIEIKVGASASNSLKVAPHAGSVD